MGGGGGRPEILFQERRRPLPPFPPGLSAPSTEKLTEKKIFSFPILYVHYKDNYFYHTSAPFPFTDSQHATYQSFTMFVPGAFSPETKVLKRCEAICYESEKKRKIISNFARYDK